MMTFIEEMTHQNNSEKSVALKTMAMKAKLANLIRKELWKFSDNDFELKYKGKKPISDQDKIEFFNKIWPVYQYMNAELRAYKDKRRFKAEVERLRKEKAKQKQFH